MFERIGSNHAPRPNVPDEVEFSINSNPMLKLDFHETNVPDEFLLG